MGCSLCLQIPTANTLERENPAIKDGATRTFAALEAENVESIAWQKVLESAAVDEECVLLARQITDGFPDDKRSLCRQIFWLG